MNKKVKFFITTIWVLFSRGYDAYCTNVFTPNLKKESNPLVTVVGISSWMPLLIIIGLLTIYVLYTYYISVFKPMNLLPPIKGYSFSNFVAFVYLGTKDNWFSIFYKLPKNINRLNHYIGQILIRCLVYAGIVSTIMWLLINHTNYYKTVHNVSLIWSILIVGCLLIGYAWNMSMYKQYVNGTNIK